MKDLWRLGCLFLLTLSFYVACGNGEKADLCNQDSDCKSGEVCQSSKCTVVEKKCLDDTGCATGEICVSNQCKQSTCESSADCPASRVCEGQRCVFPSGSEDIQEPSNVVDGGDEKTPPPDDSTGKEDVIKKDDGTQTEQPPKEEEPKICTPNRDDTIERSELQFRVGTSIIYSEATEDGAGKPLTVDMKGKDEGGVTVWDLSGTFPAAKRVVDELLSPKGAWYDSDFPGITYASTLDRSLGALGLYKVASDNVSMHGWVSEKDGDIKVTYSKPLPLFKFPLKKGLKWTASATASGTFNLAVYNASETYDFEVDGVGKLKTPTGTYPVVRLRLEFSQQQYLPTVWKRTRISYFFLSECLGVIARVDSTLYEKDKDFTEASLVKRLSD
ncbi:MAG TPA: hypothetical protein DCE42_13705 [Myxococcales bacterium]|nr:hypothetical protein [Deltaproteobacteria bacterium]MBU54155.1 hypothetical protein [Deltaproteobacteria bacterium]HAA55812.1 hypothetical protein [Myxococcales bacterium]